MKSHVVFVTGSFNEFSPGSFNPASSLRLYFGNNMASVFEDFHTTAEVVNPSTALGIKANATAFEKQISEISKRQGGKKIDVFAHSMGGSVALYAFLKSATLRQQIGHLILVHASIGGAIDLEFCDQHETFCNYFSWLMQGMIDQSPRESKELFAEIYGDFRGKVSDAERKEISNRIFFVRAKNDAVVSLRAQSHPQIGIALDPLPVTHVGLVVSLLGESSADQRAFTRAIFGLVYGLVAIPFSAGAADSRKSNSRPCTPSTWHEPRLR